MSSDNESFHDNYSPSLGDLLKDSVDFQPYFPPKAGISLSKKPFLRRYLTDGELLNDVLMELRQPIQKLPSAFSKSVLLMVFKRLCDLVTFAHRNGVFDLNLDPSHIEVTPKGDFIIDSQYLTNLVMAFSSNNMPSVDQLLKSHPIPTPEATQGDLRSLGKLLYSILTFENPFEDENDPIKMTFPPKTPKALIAICEKALSSDPQNRFANVEELTEAVDAFCKHGTLSLRTFAPPSSEHEERGTAVRKISVMIIVLILIVICAGWFYLKHK